MVEILEMIKLIFKGNMTKTLKLLIEKMARKQQQMSNKLKCSGVLAVHSRKQIECVCSLHLQLALLGIT